MKHAAVSARQANQSWSAIAGWAMACLAGFITTAGAQESVDYPGQVRPLLSRRCFACHGALKQQSGLRLDTALLAVQGGDSGPAIEPGSAAESLLIERISADDVSYRMPPEGEPLAPDEIALLKAWIDQGARAPVDEAPEEDPRQHWAFQPPIKISVPAAGGAWARNPIDAFVAQSHERHGLTANLPAPKHVLVRRLYLDLIGLPPTRDQLHAFLADSSETAYERLVDELLESPQHGERWGRHWMDVWRYSDWYGRRNVPDWWNSASQIWRWRDWIVNSLNADKGYDRMLQEMLAGDEMAPADDQAAIATGYIVRNWYALNYNQWMRDTVEHTGKAFLGLTLNCAHCHDHKYDPITQEEYFRFRAFFEPLDLRQDRVPGEPDPGPFQEYNYSELRKVVRTGLIRVFDKRPDAPTYMYKLGDERDRMQDQPPVAPGAPAFLGGDELPIEPIALPPVAYYPGLKPFVQQEEAARLESAVTTAQAAFLQATDALAVTARQAEVAMAEAALAAVEAELAALQARIAADRAKYAEPPDAMAHELALAAEQAERQASVRRAEEVLLKAEADVASRRAALDPNDEKLKQELAAAEQKATEARTALESATSAAAAEATGAYQPLSPVYPTASTGRRAALARWITSRHNPLTARVAVNQVWMRHFGRPLVESVFDFGRNGKRPSHPELLDWLAVEFMESGWSMKHLHRLIVSSNTYRTSSTPGGDLEAKGAADQDNRYLWRFNERRMEAEVVRDSMLHAAGQLDLQMGGQELANDLEATSRRRSLYFEIYPEDGGNMRFLKLFDAPDPCDCYRRSESLMPQQALVLTNSRVALAQSRLLAGKLWDELAAAAAGGAPGETAFITAAFEQVLSRGPSDQEQALCQEFLRKQAELFGGTPAEQLAAAVDGLVPPATDPSARARESLVRALFNHNDFITVR